MTLLSPRQFAVFALSAMLLSVAASSLLSQQASKTQAPALQSSSTSVSQSSSKPASQFAAAPEPDPEHAQQFWERGQHEEALGHLEAALAAYDEAVRYSPRDVTFLT